MPCDYDFKDSQTITFGEMYKCIELCSELLLKAEDEDELMFYIGVAMESFKIGKTKTEDEINRMSKELIDEAIGVAFKRFPVDYRKESKDAI